MKTIRMRPLLTCLLALTLFVSLPACAGKTARTVGTETAVVMDASVQKDVQVGIALITDPVALATANQHAGEFFSAVQTKDRPTIAAVALPLLPEMSALAESGIVSRLTNGSLNDAGARLKRKKLAEFSELITHLSERN